MIGVSIKEIIQILVFLTNFLAQKRKGAKGFPGFSFAPLRLCASTFLVLFLLTSSFSLSADQQPARDVSKQSARPVRDWVRDGVIYEIYPRAFSQKGDFNTITARLDELKELGVTIL